MQAALEMRDFIAERRRRGGAHLGIRIGVHTALSSRASSAKRNSNTTSGETR